MTAQFTAIVEDGCLRPTVPLELVEGTAVQVFIVAPLSELQEVSPAQVLARIAELSSDPVDPATSSDHDVVLYGREAHP